MLGRCVERCEQIVPDEIGVKMPIVFLIALVGVKGAYMTSSRRDPRFSHSIDRDVVVAPDVVIEHYECDIPAVLRPAFDAVWNTCGLRGSLNYNEQGWAPKS